MKNEQPDIQNLLVPCDLSDQDYASSVVDALLKAADEHGASDLHLQPTKDGLDLGWRIDGVIHPLGRLSSTAAAHVVGRLKVLADLLTYRTDVPQEGRVRAGQAGGEMRVSTFPTLYGEKAVVRFFLSNGHQFSQLEDLGFPQDIRESLRGLLGETSGAILVTGPAGSGKTTTVYTCLREELAHSERRRVIVSLEDPIEVAIPHVAQSQVNESAGFDFALGLRSLMRQDPDVIMVGEIRDRVTAGIAFQAALTGQLLLTTFHAGSTAGAINRLSDMGIEPYVLRSSILAIIAQRLVRRLCRCSRVADEGESFLDLPSEQCRVPVGCEKCHGNGYRGRLVLVEMLDLRTGGLGRAVLDKSEAQQLERLAIEGGMIPLWQRGREAIKKGLTSPAEVRRVLGTAGLPGKK